MKYKLLRLSRIGSFGSMLLRQVRLILGEASHYAI